MDSKLFKLVERVSKKSDKKINSSYSLTILNSSPNFWTIKENEYSNFWTEYVKFASHSGEYALGEVADSGAVVTEFNFKFHSDRINETNPLNEEFICEVIESVNHSLRQHLVLTSEESELICFTLESQEPMVMDEEMTYSLRLHYPLTNVNMFYQKEVLRPSIMKELRSRNVFKMLSSQPMFDWEKIFDPNIPYLYLPLYKSRCKLNHPDLLVTHIYLPTLNDETELLNEIDFHQELFDPRKHSHVAQNLISTDIFQQTQIETWLPLILSLVFWSTRCIPKEKEHENVVPECDEPIPTDPQVPLDYIKVLLTMVSDSRRDDELSWLEIGKAIYQAVDGGDEGLKLWIDFSEQSDTFDQNDCLVTYPSFKDSLITYKTIGWYAKKDNPKKFNDWYQRWVDTAFDKILCSPDPPSSGRSKTAGPKSVSLGHNDIAEAFYRCFWLEYVYSTNGSTTGRWFKYEGHRWKSLPDGTIILGQTLSSSFVRKVEQLRIKKLTEKLDTDDDDKKDLLEFQIGKIQKLLEMLSKHTSKSLIIKECKEKFYVESFEKNLDSNPNLIGMLNCVIELTNKDAVVRDGKPEDYISMSTGQTYRKDFNFENKSVRRYLNYLSSVFPDDELTVHVRKDIASMLKGRNAEKYFRVYSGSGDNSKSVYMKLLQKAFGSYCIDMPVSAITQKRNGSSNASPEFARAKGAHVAIMSEPDDEEQIKAGLVKSLTGNDRFFARFLHDNGAEVEAMFKLILVCNKIPTIPNGGKAIKNRVRVIPFLATFVDHAPEDLAEQYAKKTFKKDPDFDKYVPELAQAMIWCSIQDYGLYVKDGLVDPPIVQKETKMYWEESDPYELFIKDCLVMVYKEDGLTLDDSAELLHTEVYRIFKLWYREAFPGTKIPDSPQVRLEMIHRLGAQGVDRRWRGVMIKEEMKKF
jgi:phage/plasmid-associated DNA primase